MKTNKGFTLIEILVVIGIVALLCAIILPVLIASRKRSLTTSCASNLQQLGLAVALYSEDFDQQFPYGGDPSDIHTDVWETAYDGKYWPGAHNLTPVTVVMDPYIKDPLVWKCPSDAGFDYLDIQEFDPLSAHPSSYEAFGSSYYYNTDLALTHDTLGGLAAYDSNVPPDEHGPEQIYLLLDGCGTWHGSGDSATDSTLFRYNVLMADGHVKNLDYTTLLSIQSYTPIGN